jgi:molecular chaperone GrpE
MQENATRAGEEPNLANPAGASREANATAGSAADDRRAAWRTKAPPAQDASGATAGSPTDGAEEQDWQARFLEEQARAEDFLTKWQRAAADIANMRRRHELDRQEYTKQANASLMRDLLQVLDSFDYALAAMPADVRESPWVDGILQVERQLRAILERNGLSPIEAQGQPFDPTLHEALMQEESDQPEDTIIGELQRGYKLHDRVLRPSMVKVAKSG